MKPQFTLLLLAAAAVPGAMGQTTATPEELHVQADFDSDGRTDLAIINRADGSFRIGYQMAPGAPAWSASRAGGVPGAAWATTGALLGKPVCLAIAAPLTNQISLAAAPAADSPVVPVILYATGNGPGGILAADIGGAGNTADDDLLVFTGYNNQPSADRLETIRHTGGGAESFAPLAEIASTTFRAANRVVAKEGGPKYAGLLEGAENAATFRLADLTTGVAVDAASTAGLPGSGFVSGKFAAGNFHQFIFWRTGASEVVWRPTAALGQNGVQFTAGGSFNAGRPVGSVAVLSGGVALRLLVVASDGESAAVFEFNGAAAQLVTQMDAAPGQGFTGAFGGSDGSFTLLTGTAGSGRTTVWHKWSPAGNSYQSGDAGPMPGHRPAGTRANVFLFATEPLVESNPAWISSLNVPEWSSGIAYQGNPATLSAMAATYTGEAGGLGAPSPLLLGPAPTGAAYALGNQIRPDISLASLGNQPAPAGLDVVISPQPGLYAEAVRPTLKSVPANAEVFARVGGGPWTPAASFKPYLTAPATVQYYAKLPGSLRRTPIHSAVYQFSVPPLLIDSDQDGVPDFVEKTTVPADPDLDPNSDEDPDQDGYSDLEEFLAGTNPLDATEHPSFHEENAGSFLVRGTPRPVDGTTGLPGNAAVNVVAEVFTPDGKRLGGDVTKLGVPGLPQPSLNITGLVTESGMASVISQAVFDIVTADPIKSRGRELAALVPVPRIALPKINYVPGNGTITQEVAAWKAAALAARNASQPVIVPITPTEHQVLAALLFERWLNATALTRNLSGVTPGNVTVFPSRPGEAASRFLTPEEFADLRTRIDGSKPGWNAASVLASLQAAVVPPGTAALTQLRALATDLWRASSLLGVGENAPDYLPPLDVLRAFLRTGQLPAEYAAASTLTALQRDQAWQSIAPLLASLSPRPVATVDLEVTAQTYTGPAPRLKRADAPGEVSLLAAEGVPYQLPGSFTLVPGARIRVTGHTDLTDPEYPGDELEVISLSVILIPVPFSPDADNNLLPDAWDSFFFAGGGEPMADSDGDGFSNLQELLDGTDPQSASSKGTQAAKLDPPVIAIDVVPGEDVFLEWDYPAGYKDKIVFHIQSSPDLKSWNTIQVVPPDANGHYAVMLPAPEDNKTYYRAIMSLAD
ncbi:MAG: hypothetical protein JWL81_1790 [Verrucomicrobiales bacterium]|nr:hypothetical protein [Verrucomicrobiales bacterium]